jgi:hypothetical protein
MSQSEVSKHQQRQQKAREVPPALRGEDLTSEIVRETIWRPAARENDWRVFVIVGREGSGKSLTAASILRACDPTFTHENAHFEPVPFLTDIGRELGRAGVAAMSDESGVAFGNRTWHDRSQVEANQYLQTARDHNRIIGLTAPRLEEIDKQLRGRIHVVLETQKMRNGEWVEVKWKMVDPSRTGESKIYKKYPRLERGGRREKVTRVRIGPPPGDLAKRYQEKKARWKQDLKDRVVEQFEDEADDGEEKLTPADIADDIQSGDGVESYIKENGSQRYIDRSLIIAHYNVSEKVSKAVKSVLLDDLDDDEVM